MKKITVKAFGMVAEVLKTTELSIEAASDLDGLLQELYAQFPQLQGVKFSIAIDRQLVHGNVPLPNGCEVALLPPFSGG